MGNNIDVAQLIMKNASICSYSIRSIVSNPSFLIITLELTKLYFLSSALHGVMQLNTFALELLITFTFAPDGFVDIINI